MQSDVLMKVVKFRTRKGTEIQFMFINIANRCMEEWCQGPMPIHKPQKETTNGGERFIDENCHISLKERCTDEQVEQSCKNVKI